MSPAGLYARVFTNDQQTLAMQNRAMREYAARRGWTIAWQVREVNSGTAHKANARKDSFDLRPRELVIALCLRLPPKSTLCFERSPDVVQPPSQLLQGSFSPEM
jgi:hypothetical protein